MTAIYPLRIVSGSTARAQRFDFDPELDLHLFDMLDLRDWRPEVSSFGTVEKS